MDFVLDAFAAHSKPSTTCSGYIAQEFLAFSHLGQRPIYNRNLDWDLGSSGAEA
jgi:hypothetical protein